MDFKDYNFYNGLLKDNQEVLINPLQSSQKPFKITLKQLRDFVENNIQSGIEEAPIDGTLYGRQNGSWVSIAGGLETDPIWTADKPNYLTSATAAATYSLLGHTHTFASITSKPTTLSGYGITDAYPLSGNPSGFLTSFTETDPLAVKLAGSYANPSWITSLAWSKITGAPSFLTAGDTGFNLKTTGFTIGAGLTVFYDAYGTSNFGASEIVRSCINQYTGLVKDIYVYINTNQPASGSLVITLRQTTGGPYVDTSCTLTIAAGSVAGVYSVTGLSTPLTAGSNLTYKVVNNATTFSAQLFSIGLLIEH
jgi:hypothetical protein